MNIQESGQMYLETIYVLLSERGTVRAIDVGEHMGYSKPSVSRAMGILKKEGLIRIDQNGHITLTEKGKTEAEKICSVLTPREVGFCLGNAIDLCVMKALAKQIIEQYFPKK